MPAAVKCWHRNAPINTVIGDNRPMRILHCSIFLAVATLLLPAHAAGLAQLKIFLESAHSAKAAFSQTVVAKSARKPQKSSGFFVLQRPGKFRWSYEKPYKQVLVSDGRKLWSYDPDLNQVAVKKLDAAFGASPAALLAGQHLERHFELAEGAAVDGIEYVDAKPKGTDASFERVRIGFIANLPVSMEIHDSFGQVTLLSFSQFEANPALPAALFRFVTPAGADVVGE
jgi:outer membrane lipoprotein carrier protein